MLSLYSSQCCEDRQEVKVWLQGQLAAVSLALFTFFLLCPLIFNIFFPQGKQQTETWVPLSCCDWFQKQLHLFPLLFPPSICFSMWLTQTLTAAVQYKLCFIEVLFAFGPYVLELQLKWLFKREDDVNVDKLDFKHQTFPFFCRFRKYRSFCRMVLLKSTF